MKRWLWFLIATTALGCRSASKPAQPASKAAAPTPSAQTSAAPAAGDYACNIEGYPEFLCRVTAEADFLTLEKLGGSDRWRGSLTRDGDDVRWINAEAGAEPAELVFKPQGDGSWLAKLAMPGDGDGEPLAYRLRYLGDLGSQFGGQSYAGAIGAPAGSRE
jgi:hypothetical protein